MYKNTLKENKQNNDNINTKIDYNCNKEIKDTNTKKKKNKRPPEEGIESLMLCDKDNYNNKTNKKGGQTQNINDDDESEEYISQSSSDEEVFIDEDHDENSDDYMDEDGDKVGEIGEKNIKVNIWDENNKLNDDQLLDFDNEAYEMLHRSKIEWPCMTLDFVLPREKHNLLDNYPYSCYMVAGAQTNTQNGYLYCMKWFNMHKTKYDDDPDKAADSDEEDGQEPLMKFEKIQVKGNINRIKTTSCCNNYPFLAAYWSDYPCVEIVNLKELISNLDQGTENTSTGNKKRKTNHNNISLKSFARKNEGFALEWSKIMPGLLAAGGLDKIIEIYKSTDESCSDWVLEGGNNFGTLKGHKGSIEDIIWSPVQAHVLASCSVDKSIRFWDLRSDKSNPPIVIDNAHDSDVNCLAWNTFCDFMVASGGEDGSFKVWDIRYISNGPISNIQWHKGAITALSWDPFEDSQIAVSSEDNRLSVWDFSVEPDDQHLFDSGNKEVPQQLIFLHQGQENIKDIKFHPVYKNFIASTAENGINVFKPAFDEDSSIASDEMMDIEN